VWCDLSAGLYNGSRGLGPDSQDVSNGWNGRPEGASATRDCGGGPTGRSSPTAPLRAGEGLGGKGPIPARPHPKPSNSRRHLDYLTMRGGGRVRGAGARLPGSAQSARGGPGRGRAGTGPDSTCGEDLTELGDWPRKGLPVAWQRGPTTRLLHCGGAGTGAHGWAASVSRHASRQWGCCCSVWAGWQSCHPNTVASGPMCKTPGGPHWSRGLGQAVVNWVRQHSTTAAGPGSRIQGRTSNREPTRCGRLGTPPQVGPGSYIDQATEHQ
jgi:hypothetical protein